MKKIFCTTTQIIKKNSEKPIDIQIGICYHKSNQYSYSTIADKILPIGLTCT